MTTAESPRIARERRTVGHMIDIYCHARHASDGTRCSQCGELFAYAMARLDRCVYGADKPTCRKCPVHCYKKDMRAEMRNVMAYAGPRMMLSHPVLAVQHMLAERGEPPPPPSRRPEG